MTHEKDCKMIEKFLAVDGIPVDPELPANWDNLANDARPACHMLIWGRPYIVTWTPTDKEADLIMFKRYWPTGTRYTVRCLDGGAWDRSTNCGSFQSLEEARDWATQLARDYDPKIMDLLKPIGAPPTPGETTITVNLTVTITNGAPEVVEIIRDGLEGDDLQMTEYGERENLNDAFREMLHERLSPDYNEVPAWYDDDWDFEAKFEVK